jgi:hypothetical protein
MQINFVDLLIQNAIDAHSDLTANSFDGVVNAAPNAINAPYDLVAI